MREVIAWDTETALIRPGTHAPELVCLTYQGASYSTQFGGWVPWHHPEILHHTEARPVFVEFLESDRLLVGHNVSYDMAVMAAKWPDLVPLIFDVYEADRVTDTMVREQLLDIAGGTYRGRLGEENEWIKKNYGLGDIVREHTGRWMVKDGWRMFYWEFHDVPIARWVEHAPTVQAKYRPDFEWLLAEQKAAPKTFSKKQLLADLREMVTSDPRGCIQYPLDDATGTLDGFIGQEGKRPDLFLKDQFRQVRKEWWLQLMSTWGLRTSKAGVERMRRAAEEAHAEVKARLVERGLVRAKDGSRDTKAAAAHMISVCVGQGLPIRRTKTAVEKMKNGIAVADEEGIALDEDACKATDDDVLHDYARFCKLSKVLSNDVKALILGTIYPIHTHFGRAETCRTTSSNPNVQNWGRKGGARESFMPREGFIYGSCDVDQLELRTLAQACIRLLGASVLGDVINSGKDPHTMLAVELWNASGRPTISYERGMELKGGHNCTREDADLFDNLRQTAKVANFGLPGGLGAAKLVLFARKSYGVDLGQGAGEEAAVRAAKELKRKWLAQWPEMALYFEYVNSLKNPQTDLYNLVQLFSERIRGGARYTAACNSFFQGLGADATGRGGWYVARAAYAEPKAALFGCRPVNYVHDDLLNEIPLRNAIQVEVEYKGRTVVTIEDAQASDAAKEMARLFVKGINEFLPDVPATAEPLLTRIWSKGAKRLTNKQTGHILVWSPELEKKAA